MHPSANFATGWNAWEKLELKVIRELLLLLLEKSGFGQPNMDFLKFIAIFGFGLTQTDFFLFFRIASEPKNIHPALLRSGFSHAGLVLSRWS